MARELHLISADFQFTCSDQVLLERRKHFLGHARKFTAQFFREHGWFQRIRPVKLLEQLHDLGARPHVLFPVQQPGWVVLDRHADASRSEVIQHCAQGRLVKGATQETV